MSPRGSHLVAAARDASSVSACIARYLLQVNSIASRRNQLESISSVAVHLSAKVLNQLYLLV